MFDLAKAFSTFANQGVTVPLVSVLKVQTYDGITLEEYDAEKTANLVSVLPEDWATFWSSSSHSASPSAEPVTTLPKEVTFIISDILADNSARSAAFGTNSLLVIPNHTVSVKTGTTNDLKDNWTIGYTPDFLAATWVGNNDNTSMSYVASGVTGASPIWNSIMKKLLKEIKDKPLSKPENVTNFQVCNSTGLLAQQENQCESHSEYFVKEILPLGQSGVPVRKQIWVNRADKSPIQENDTTTIDRDLEEHTVLSDPFIKEFCLDCNYPLNEKGSIQWPQTNVNMSTFKANPKNYLNLNVQNSP